MYVVKLRMETGFAHSHSLQKISGVYLEEKGTVHLCTVDEIYSILVKKSGSIRVGAGPAYPVLVPRLSSNGKCCVCSDPCVYGYDYLFLLPRE